MKSYARMVDGLVVELIEPFAGPDGQEVPIEDRFTPDIVAQLIEYDPANPPSSPLPAQSPVEIRIATLRNAVQAHLDARAQLLGYDDIKTAVTYAEEAAVAKFQAEGKALRAWRSYVWARCYEVLAAWQAGDVDEPSVEQLMAMLPAIESNQTGD